MYCFGACVGGKVVQNGRMVHVYKRVSTILHESPWKSLVYVSLTDSQTAKQN